jgi:hypothetical protein
MIDFYTYTADPIRPAKIDQLGHDLAAAGET